MLKTNSLIDGLKTGWTHDAGYCITTTMKQDGMRLVCVVMGAESPTLRNADVMNLLNYGFANFTIDLMANRHSVRTCPPHLLQMLGMGTFHYCL